MTRYGSWGCCFTYGTWFGVEGLVLSGEPAGSDHLRRACAFLLAKQNPNGGWGEDFTSCYNKAYARDGMTRFGSGGSGVVNTAWAMLALLAANCDDDEALRRGAAYLMSEQLPNGDWKQEGIAGVFNRACGISYTQYRNIFPMWALARYARHAEVHMRHPNPNPSHRDLADGDLTLTLTLTLTPTLTPTLAPTRRGVLPRATR